MPGEPEPDLTSLVITHRAIGQDLGRLAASVAEMASRGAAPGRELALQHYAAALVAQIRAHHRCEDEIVWPVIAAAAGQAVDLAPLIDDHQAIEEAADRVSRALGLPGHSHPALAEAGEALSALRDMVGEHMADEERQVFPVMRRYVRMQVGWWCQRQAFRTTRAGALPFRMAWLARYSQAGEMSCVLTAAGPRARIALVAGRPRYARLERQAFGALHSSLIKCDITMVSTFEDGQECGQTGGRQKEETAMGLPGGTVAGRFAVPADTDKRAVARYPRREDGTEFEPIKTKRGSGSRKLRRLIPRTWPERAASARRSCAPWTAPAWPSSADEMGAQTMVTSTREPGRAAGGVAVEIAHLRKAYGAVVAVEDVSLSVAEGEVFGILGPNGAGKTTTVECAVGLRSPDSGTIRLMGLDPRTERDAVREVVGVQLQESAFPAKLRVGEILQEFRSFYRHPAKVTDLVEGLGLADKRGSYYRSLSGGQRQRLSVAVALIGGPKIAMLDEMTAGLDPQARRDTWELIEGVRDRGVTIVLVTHFMEEAERLCDRVALIDKGRIVALDTPAGLVARARGDTSVRFVPSAPFDDRLLAELPGVRRVEHEGQQVIVTGTGELVSVVIVALHAAGVEARDVQVGESSLEDAFVQLTGRHLQHEAEQS